MRGHALRRVIAHRWSRPRGQPLRLSVQVVSGGSDWQVKLWVAATGQLVAQLAGHTLSVRSVIAVDGDAPLSQVRHPAPRTDPFSVHARACACTCVDVRAHTRSCLCIYLNCACIHGYVPYLHALQPMRARYQAQR